MVLLSRSLRFRSHSFAIFSKTIVIVKCVSYVFLFFSAKSLRTASNMFVVNLAFLDFVMMLKAPFFIYNSFKQGFAAGMLGCKLFAGAGSISGIGAGMTNACIAYDRYTTITRPFDGKITRTKALIMILFVWIYTLPWTFMPMFEVWGRFVPGNKAISYIF